MKIRLRSRTGQVAVVGAVSMVVILATVCAMAVDVGQIMLKRAQLQNGADAACLAAMQQVAYMRRNESAKELIPRAAKKEGRRLGSLNCPDAAVEIVLGTYDPDCGFTPGGKIQHVNACRATLRRAEGAPGGSLKLVFGPLLGKHSTDISASAVAAVTSRIRGVNRGLTPFAIWEDALLPEGEEMIFYPSQGQGETDAETGGTIVPGVFGLLDYNGGSNDTPDLREWILNGYDGGFGVDPETGKVLIEGNTGFRAALESTIREKLGEEIVIAVYDDVWGTGSNAKFQVVGFLSMILTDVDLSPPQGEPYVKGMLGPLLTVSEVTAGFHGVPSPNLQKVVLAQ